MNNKSSYLLGIIGIISLLSLIILPPLYRYLYPKDNTVEISDDTIIKDVTCKRNNFEFKIFTNENMINLISITKNTNLTEDFDMTTLDNKKTEFGDTDIYYNYNIDNNIITEDYRVYFPSEDIPVVIENVEITNNYQNLIKNLRNNNYTCE